MLGPSFQRTRDHAPATLRDSIAVRKLSCAPRGDNKGDRFDGFSKEISESAAGMFVSARYDTLQSIKDMQELGRAYLLSGIRVERKDQPNSPELRLTAGLFDTYGVTATPK